MAGYTHFDDAGNAVMVDVTDKSETVRSAVAAGSITMNEESYRLLKEKGHKKGDVLAVARIAGIMGAKRTSDLIPLCHILPLTKVSIDYALDDAGCKVEASCTVKTTGKTGVEMEALTGTSVCLLSIYDCCKAIDRAMVIGDIRLIRKTGGKSDYTV